MSTCQAITRVLKTRFFPPLCVRPELQNPSLMVYGFYNILGVSCGFNFKKVFVIVVNGLLATQDCVASDQPYKLNK